MSKKGGKDMWIHIDGASVPEFLGQILDLFDDFLEERHIVLPESLKEMIQDGELDDDVENSAVIYGTEYGILEEELEKIMKRWSVSNKSDREDGKYTGNDHNVEITCECTMRSAHTVSVSNECYEAITEGDTSSIAVLFDRTIEDGLSGTGTVETDYTVYDLDKDKQVVDWR